MRRWLALFALASALTVSMAAPASAAAPDLRAVYGGEPIPLVDVGDHHCHDGALVEIRCFGDAHDRDADASIVSGARAMSPPRGSTGTQVLYYVTFYQHEYYGGNSYTASQPLPDLTTTIGWNDAISSFKSLNGRRPKWWEHVNYAPTSWQWAAGAQIVSVGQAANDRFSSAKDVP
jgi:hypothetical protein